MVMRASPDTLLRTVLPSVARSFYLTLAVVPSDVRTQVGVAYLLARAADTITDTDLIERSQRLQYLTRFREWVMNPIQREDALREMQEALLVHLADPRRGLQTRPGERTLLTHLVECDQLLHNFAPGDRALISQVVGTLAHGMQKDLTRFPGRTISPGGGGGLVALTTLDLLDQSTLPKFRPVLMRLLRAALEHLDQGWLYTMAIPRREVRLRLACAWPILFAVKTLQRVSVSPSLLDPGVTLKMTRGEVYRVMALTTGTLGCGRL